MSEPVKQETENAAPKPSKKEQRFAAAKQLMKDWADEEKDEDIVSGLAYRAHLVAVMKALGIENADDCLVAGVDRRIACGLEELNLLGLAFSGKLLKAIEESNAEVAEKTVTNTAEAKAEMERRKIEGDPRNGPVKRPSRRQSM